MVFIRLPVRILLQQWFEIGFDAFNLSVQEIHEHILLGFRYRCSRKKGLYDRRTNNTRKNVVSN